MVERIIWALRRRDMPGRKVLRASGNWLAPWIFCNRDGARRAARECKEHGFDVVPVRVKLSVRVQQIREAR